mmetsp:Transcript_14163/g.31459  ORF Transcript_14163/g.31459 Transcript_14163/m.31459 type:complete len:462 (-) Transcript_14163:107-1492(-)|eukprot:CAMPEP_0204259550 /NCGR_PEP_ID=MMETSP0468-20130131/5713_1 /ASSEMBLY_ACC=CAM_ASM_000383 /TAXON_ID=2969 /ORGANISM="Oxyrrhis marina" /LENGTH=461 /DNA_ID=CAMNT_0051233857 /DNA_START=63 /DNA_END=1448 /DNA_ORIENTATION=-
MFGGNNEFSNMIQQAVKMKSAQMEQERRWFEKVPNFIQHTLFHGEKDDFKAWRVLPIDERIAKADDIKSEGNALFSERNYVDATEKYEQAGGLFHYVYSVEPEWKKKGLKDDVLRLQHDPGDTDEQQKQIDKIRISCFLNIAICQLKLKNWDTVIKACGETLELDPKNKKAFYRRAQALIGPPGHGGHEVDRAIADLQHAAKIDPSDTQVRDLLDHLRKDRQKQLQKDKGTFAGMFGRGSIYGEQGSAQGAVTEAAKALDQRLNPGGDGPKEGADDTSLETKITEAELLRDLYMRNGKEDEAKDLDQKIREAKKALKDQKSGKLPPPPDFSNPTEEMVKDAKDKFGIDLQDPLVQKELERLSKAKEEGKDLDSLEAQPEPVEPPKPMTPEEKRAAKQRAKERQRQFLKYFIPIAFAGTFWRMYSLGLIQPLMELPWRRYITNFFRSLVSKGYEEEEGDEEF